MMAAIDLNVHVQIKAEAPCSMFNIIGTVFA